MTYLLADIDMGDDRGLASQQLYESDPGEWGRRKREWLRRCSRVSGASETRPWGSGPTATQEHEGLDDD